MRTIVLLAAPALAVLLASCASREGAGDPLAHVWRSHDEAEACTSVIGRVFAGRPGSAGRSVDMHLRVDVSDSTPGAAVDSVRVMVHAAHDGSTGTPEEAPPLLLTLDGRERLRYEGDTGHSLLSKRPGGGAVDRVDYMLPIADLARIAAARRVEGDAGVARFTLAAEEIAVFGAYAAAVSSPEGWRGIREGGAVGPDCYSLLGGR